MFIKEGPTVWSIVNLSQSWGKRHTMGSLSKSTEETPFRNIAPNEETDMWII